MRENHPDRDLSHIVISLNKKPSNKRAFIIITINPIYIKQKTKNKKNRSLLMFSLNGVKPLYDSVLPFLFILFCLNNFLNTLNYFFGSPFDYFILIYCLFLTMNRRSESISEPWF